MVRYLLQQPDTLESTAMVELGGWITSQAEKLIHPLEWRGYTPKAEEFLSQRIEIIRNYIEHHMPGKFQDDLLKAVIPTLSALARKNRVIERMIETLFTKNITTVSLKDSYTWTLYKDSFSSRSFMLTGLTDLTLLLENTNEAQMIEIFLQLPNLKILALRHIQSDAVLRCIAENCKLIETLDLYDRNITDDSLQILTQLPKLRNVEIYSLDVTPVGTAAVLLSCDNIEHISTNNDITEVLKYIVSFSENVGKKFKLKSYTNNNETYLKGIQLAVEMCPLMLKMNLLREDSVELEDSLLQPLIGFQDIRGLTLRNYCFYEHQLKDYLQVRGCQMEQLFLLYAYEIDLNALKYIVLTCPNLEKLGITYNYSGTSEMEYGSFPCETEIPPLKHLKSLVVKSNEKSLFTEDHIVFLLSSCPNVEYLEINVIQQLPDDIILQVLDKKPKQLMYLKQLYISFDLSMSTIDRIVQNCINTPEIFTNQLRPAALPAMLQDLLNLSG